MRLTCTFISGYRTTYGLEDSSVTASFIQWQHKQLLTFLPTKQNPENNTPYKVTFSQPIHTDLASLLCFLCSSDSLKGSVGIQKIPCRPLRLRFLQKKKKLAQHLSYIQYQNPLVVIKMKPNHLLLTCRAHFLNSFFSWSGEIVTFAA